MPRKSFVTKKELARFKAMDDLGVTPHAIGKKTGRDPKTVRKWLQSEVYNDPDLMRMVDAIKKKELADLYLLGGKARAHLHTLLDGGGMKAIETVATMDRSFQQRRLLEGQSTSNTLEIRADIMAIRDLIDKGGWNPLKNE
jgi:hypothetical protein